MYSKVTGVRARQGEACSVPLEASEKMWLEGKQNLVESERMSPASLSMVNAHPLKENHKNQQGVGHSDLSALISAAMRADFEGWGITHPTSAKSPKHPCQVFPNKHAI